MQFQGFKSREWYNWIHPNKALTLLPPSETISIISTWNIINIIHCTIALKPRHVFSGIVRQRSIVWY
eukprot:jgi/Chrzof1/2208/Cz11g06130.t1